jgi:hypothetical protein
MRDSGRTINVGKSDASTDATKSGSRLFGAPGRVSDSPAGSNRHGRSGGRDGKVDLPGQGFAGSQKTDFAPKPARTTFVAEKNGVVSVGVSSCGHSVCGSRSSCGLSTKFYSPCKPMPVCDPYRYRYCDYGWSGFGFYYHGSSFSIGFSWWDDWCGYRPSYFYSHGYYNPCRFGCCCARPYCTFRVRYYPVYYSLPTYVYEPVYTSYPDYSTPSYSSPVAYSSNDGWGLLADGNARDARRAFDRQMNAYQNDGLAYIGYALAAALLNRDDEAVAVMRLAMRIDPESILEVPFDQRLHDQIWFALDLFLDRADRNPQDVDAQFMIAALRFMMGDSTLSFFAIDRALDGGDMDQSAMNLRALIRQAMEETAPFVPATPSSPPANEPVVQPEPTWNVPL